MRTVTIDGVSVTVDNEILRHTRRDDELETIEIVLKDTTQLEPYDMGLQVIINSEDYYLTGADNIVRTGIGYYNHRITLIESYKALERDILSSLQYTQPLDGTKYTCLDVLDRALKLIEIEKTSNLGASRKYDISGVGTRDSNDNYVVGNLTGFALQLYNKKAPEMQFNTPSVREVFDEVFLLFDGRPILEEFTTINIKLYNTKGNSISLNEVSEISGNQDIDKNAQKYDIYLENAISENNVNKQARIFPSSTAWGSVRSDEVELTTNNFIMEVNEDIERVLEFRLYAYVDIDYVDNLGGSQNFTGTLNIDMTDWLFTKRAWTALNYNVTPASWVQDKYRNNSLYFEGNQIKGWHDVAETFTITSCYNWHFVLGQMLYNSNPSGVTAITITDAIKPKFVNGVEEFMFRLTYVPKETTRIQLERDVSTGYGTLRFNQKARIVDSELLGNNTQSILNRDGEKVLVFSKTVDSLEEAFNVNDYYLTYKGTKLDNIEYANGQVLSTLTLSKNYAKKSERIDISNRPRQTQISEQNTIRNDIINEYCDISFTQETINTSSLTGGTNRILRTFDATATGDNPVEFALWNDEIIIEATSQGIGKMMSCKFQFPDNITAGKKTVLFGSIQSNEYVEYAVDGELDNATIKFYDGMTPNPDTYAQAVIVAKELPSYNASNITLGSQLVNLGERRILKDSGEVYALTYQVTFSTDEEEVFIGNKLAQENAFVVKSTEPLYLFSQATPFTFGQNIDSTLTKQLLVTGTPTAGTQVKISTFNNFGNGELRFTTNFDNSKFWAIANIKGEVYLIVNKLLQDRVYLNFKEKRSD